MDKIRKIVVPLGIVMAVFSLIFWENLIECKSKAGQISDLQDLLCAISGIPLVENFLDCSMMTMKWIFGFSVLFLFVGKESYVLINDLKYMALVRYGSYHHFYRMLMNQTVLKSLLYGTVGVGVTWLLYVWKGNGQLDQDAVLWMSALYIMHLILLCLVQTIGMILTGGFTSSIVLLASWMILAMSGHLLFPKLWKWIPASWGMYMRTDFVLDTGIFHMIICIEAFISLLLWWLMPGLLKKEVK